MRVIEKKTKNLFVSSERSPFTNSQVTAIIGAKTIEPFAVLVETNKYTDIHELNFNDRLYTKEMAIPAESGTHMTLSLIFTNEEMRSGKVFEVLENGLKDLGEYLKERAQLAVSQKEPENSPPVDSVDSADLLDHIIGHITGIDRKTGKEFICDRQEKAEKSRSADDGSNSSH